MDVQPRAGGGGGGETSDQIVWRVCDSTRATVPHSIDKSQINQDLLILDDMGQQHSLTTVLIHETDRFNTLLALIHSSLNDLQKAIKASTSFILVVLLSKFISSHYEFKHKIHVSFQGIVVMSEAIEEVFVAFLNNKVPNMWHKKGYNSLKSLGSWIHDLTLRVDFIEVTV